MNLFQRGMVVAMLTAAPVVCGAQISVAGPVQAGAGVTLQATGSGVATLYLFGPGGASKREVQRGSIAIPGDELQIAGRYTAILDGSTATFFVTAAPLAKMSFIARPSRVPAAASGGVLGSAYLFDRYQNLILAPTPVGFRLGMDAATDEERKAMSHNGVAYMQLSSGRRSGPAQFTASSGDVSVRRVVQQVAADPCAIRMKASPATDGNILVETAPIQDCSGNAVPDGTIVTFTSVDKAGRSTVDARVKRGFARAELPSASSATLSVAAGVVMGNEIHWGGAQ